MSSSFEVQVQLEGRWQTREIADEKEFALDRGTALAEEAQCDAVRVIESAPKPDGTIVEKTVFEKKVARKKATPVTAQQVDSAPLCETVEQVFQLEARLTAGRILRGYLDEEGLTVSELMTDPGLLGLLARHETILTQSVGVASSVQAKLYDLPQRQRADVLYALFDDVKNMAAALAGTLPAFKTVLAEEGIDGLVSGVAALPEEQRYAMSIAALASLTREEGEPASKMEKLLDLIPPKQPLPTPAHKLLDEMLSEILDSGDGVRAVLGHQSDLASAVMVVSGLVSGKLNPSAKAPTVQGRLHSVFRIHPFPACRGALNRWISLALNSLAPLTREGGEQEQSALVDVLASMLMDDGLTGGPTTSAAITQRARSVLISDPSNQRVEDAIDALLQLIPAKSAKVGYLADVSTTEDVGAVTSSAILEKLADIMRDIRSLGDLAPPGATRREAEDIQQRLISKIDAAPLPDEIKQGFSAKIETLRPGGGRSIAMSPSTPKPGDKQRKVKAGDVIFKEGMPGEEAFMIRKGAVDITVSFEGKTITIASLGPGEIFGEMALIDNLPRAAGAVAAVDSELLVVRSPPFRRRLDALSENDPILRHLIDIYVSRLRTTIRKLNE
ncbi:cyclic nucleotide-binding domain-containing protein [Hwanghaeella grinnelliae]|uniref:Cyclic nucleotide-binding domain-containing protein n=1 Tax=Hwanghaeella grinnelliae TaxID=2500179 RepID=A0A3S3UMH0_9PROT|nr:cyclic nucleotide-binding domain-containing protein [Hwanghaeella grinnelliae]RVU34982.1 cyclic nucleotide-binding domain-containing protein [Hwanghaeella grinnelliae]